MLLLTALLGTAHFASGMTTKMYKSKDCSGDPAETTEEEGDKIKCGGGLDGSGTTAVCTCEEKIAEANKFYKAMGSTVVVKDGECTSNGESSSIVDCGGLSGGAIAGIVIGCVVGVVRRARPPPRPRMRPQ